MKAKLFIFALIGLLGSISLKAQQIDSAKTFHYTVCYQIQSTADKVIVGDVVFCDTIGSTVNYDSQLKNFEVTINNHLEILQNMGNFPDHPNVYKLLAADGARMILYIEPTRDLIQTEHLLFELTDKKIECK